jgi:hypothetical protein
MKKKTTLHRIAFVIHQCRGEIMKYWKIILGAVVIAFAVNASFATAIKVGAPKGWQLWGPEGDKYEIGIDPAEGTPEHPALIIASKTEATDEVFAIFQQIDSSQFQGKMIEFSMMARAVGAKENRIWLQHILAGELLMQEIRSIPDGRGWERIVLRLYVPHKPALEFHNLFQIGIGLGSPGKIWIKDVKLTEVILQRQPANNTKYPRMSLGVPVLGGAARNLNFIE